CRRRHQTRVSSAKCRPTSIAPRRPSTIVILTDLRLGWDQPKIAEAGVHAPTNDEVIMYRYPEYCGGLDEVVGYGDIRCGRGWITGGVIVHEDQRRRSKV